MRPPAPFPRAGLIPAWAGKTRPPPTRAPARPAHPRVGGENLLGAAVIVDWDGSSPRGRGKLDGMWAGIKSAGLIPAWAGKTVYMGR